MPNQNQVDVYEKFFDIVKKSDIILKFARKCYIIGVEKRNARRKGVTYMTLTELAKLAHVSTSTASKAFSQSDEVNQQTRDMIFEIAKKHGCFKRFYRSEFSGLVIAVICPEFDSTYYSAFIASMQKHIAKYNSEICVASTEFSREKEQKLIEYYERHNTVDGIILINGISDLTPKNEIPMATVNCFTKNLGTINVEKDLLTPTREAIDAWVTAGVSDIGFIGDSHTNARCNMVTDILIEYFGKIQSEYFSITDDRFERGGYLAMCELIKKGTLPRAIVCAYDRLATGALRALNEHGLSVPHDVAIVSFDDAASSAFMNPPLSSINHEIEETSKAAVTALFKKIRGELDRENIKIIGTLKSRESSKIY